MSKLIKKALSPYIVGPLAGATIGAGAGLLFGPKNREFATKENVKRLLRNIILGGGVGLGLTAMGDGGSRIIDALTKGASVKKKANKSRLLAKLIKKAAGNDFWSGPNANYAIAGGTGLLSSLLLYHFLNDEKKRNLGGYLSSGLLGLGGGLLGAGLHNNMVHGKLRNSPAGNNQETSTQTQNNNGSGNGSAPQLPTTNGQGTGEPVVPSDDGSSLESFDNGQSTEKSVVPSDDGSSLMSPDNGQGEGDTGNQDTSSGSLSPYVIGATATTGLFGLGGGATNAFLRNRKLHSGNLKTYADNGSNWMPKPKPKHRIIKNILRVPGSFIPGVNMEPGFRLGDWLGQKLFGSTIPEARFIRAAINHGMAADLFGKKGFAGTRQGKKLSDRKARAINQNMRDALGWEHVATQFNDPKSQSMAAISRQRAMRSLNGLLWGEIPEIMQESLLRKYNTANPTAPIDTTSISNFTFRPDIPVADLANAAKLPLSDITTYRAPANIKILQGIRGALPQDVLENLGRAEYIADTTRSLDANFGNNRPNAAAWDATVNDYFDSSKTPEERLRAYENLKTMVSRSEFLKGTVEPLLAQQQNTNSPLKVARDAFIQNPLDTQLYDALEIAALDQQMSNDRAAGRIERRKNEKIPEAMRRIKDPKLEDIIRKVDAATEDLKHYTGNNAKFEAKLQGALYDAMNEYNLYTSPNFNLDPLRKGQSSVDIILNGYKQPELTDSAKIEIANGVNGIVQDTLDPLRADIAEGIPVLNSTKEIIDTIRQGVCDNLNNNGQTVLADYVSRMPDSEFIGYLEESEAYKQFTQEWDTSKVDAAGKAGAGKTLHDPTVSPELIKELRNRGNIEALRIWREMNQTHKTLVNYQNTDGARPETVAQLQEKLENLRYEFRRKTEAYRRSPTLVDLLLGREFVPAKKPSQNPYSPDNMSFSTGNTSLDTGLSNLGNKLFPKTSPERVTALLQDSFNKLNERFNEAGDNVELKSRITAAGNRLAELQQNGHKMTEQQINAEIDRIMSRFEQEVANTKPPKKPIKQKFDEARQQNEAQFQQRERQRRAEHEAKVLAQQKYKAISKAMDSLSVLYSDEYFPKEKWNEISKALAKLSQLDRYGKGMPLEQLTAEANAIAEEVRKLRTSSEPTKLPKPIVIEPRDEVNGGVNSQAEQQIKPEPETAREWATRIAREGKRKRLQEAIKDEPWFTVADDAEGNPHIKVIDNAAYQKALQEENKQLVSDISKLPKGSPEKARLEAKVRENRSYIDVLREAGRRTVEFAYEKGKRLLRIAGEKGKRRG